MKRAGPERKRSTKKAKFKVIEIDSSTNAARPSLGEGSSTGSQRSESTRRVDARSYDVYTLADGRLGAKHRDAKVAPSAAEIFATGWGTATAESLSTETDADALANFQADTVDMEHSVPPPRRKRPELKAAARINDFRPLRQEFLDELLRFEGPEADLFNNEVLCTLCDTQPAKVRCRECDRRELYCAGCTVVRHRDLALHTVEEWDGKKFAKTSLRQLGLIVQLGHSNAECENARQRTRCITVAHTNGIHEVAIRFCECLDASESFVYEWTQLFRHGWFPATTLRPNTVFTFQLLDFFQETSFQSKISLYDLWKSIERLTDNSGCVSILNRYRQISHIIRIWRNLQMLKRGGRAHDPTGVAGTGEGCLAVECPACPQPGKNLPEGWEDAPASIKWLYTLFLMMDANFRAKCKDRGLNDTELSPGWSYFVEDSKYLGYAMKQGAQTDTSTCTAEHKAILQANLRRDGYIASGVGAVLCARHALVRKNGAGDLQNGEKYCNMDYLLFASLMGISILFRLLISYDIACQWHRKLPQRVAQLPPTMQHDLSVIDITYAIPKKHYRVHGANHSQWSLNYKPHVGRTYGEGIESHWSHMNPISLSAREMSPSVRHEVLDDHWGAWNWQKVIGLAPHLLRSLVEAVQMSAAHRKNYTAFTATFKPDVVQQWQTALDAWHANPGKGPDPYEDQNTTASLKSVRLQIAMEEAADIADGNLPAHEVSEGVFLQMALELEEQQRDLRMRATKTDITSRAALQEKRNTLRRRIELWQLIQDIHMPAAAGLRNTAPAALAPATTATLSGSTGPAAAAGLASTSVPSSSTSSASVSTKVEDIALWLPSAFPDRLRTSSALAAVHNKEHRLRLAQADDALDDIRRFRRILTGITEFRRLNVTGTGLQATSRVRDLYNTFQNKITRAAERYRAARSALLSLDPTGDWLVRLKVLHNEDVRGPRRDDDYDAGEGRYESSWIWLIPLAPGQAPLDADDPAEFASSMRVEWARVKARAERWEEEVALLEEEMRRCIAYFEWKVRWWREQAEHRPNSPIPLRMGLRVYAEKQAAVFEGLAQNCASLWLPFYTLHKLSPPAWGSRYTVSDPGGHARVKYFRKVILRGGAEEDKDSTDDSDDSDEEEE